MAVRRAKNYWDYKRSRQRRHQLSTALHEAKWGKALAAVLLCLSTLLVVLVFSPGREGSGNAAKGVAETIEPIFATQQTSLPMDTQGGNIDYIATETEVPETTPEPTRDIQVNISAIDKAPNSDKQPAVALTFDDGPSYKTTPRLLDELKKRNLKATFFILGTNIDDPPRNAEVLKRTADEGHEIGNHSFAHSNLRSLDDDALYKELVDTNAIIKDSGGQARLLRPPYGAYDKRVLKFAEDNDMRVITWNIDTNDWKYKDDPDGARAIADHVLENVKDGDIILMHDIYDNTVDAAIILMDELRNRGYQLLTVEELITR